MLINRCTIDGGEFSVPGILILPEKPAGAVVIVHGFGGCKEEQLGLAWRVAEAGFAACVIDLRGHGEHQLCVDEDILSDVETAVQYCRAFGKVAAVGHSLGGRLSLLSSADCVVAISPALTNTYSSRTHEMVTFLRAYRVRKPDTEVIFRTIESYPEWQPGDGRKVTFIYGERDIQDIIAACRELKSKGAVVIEIEKALHGDIHLLEKTFETVISALYSGI
ncbi:MAG: alpha/beta hydrolase [Vulcanimicrobiota bacterium]